MTNTVIMVLTNGIIQRQQIVFFSTESFWNWTFILLEERGLKNNPILLSRPPKIRFLGLTFGGRLI